MNPGLYAQLARIEDRHWWHVSRRKQVEDVLSRLLPGKTSWGLDIGCGTGGNRNVLAKYCVKAVGLDNSSDALKWATHQWSRSELIRGDANHLDKLFLPETFGLVTVFHVLYHQWIRDEGDILKQAFRVLKPGGYLVITEPAFPCLTRRHDLQDMGKTRYRLGSFQRMLREAGFEIIMGTYVSAVSFLPAFVIKWVERLGKINDSGADDLVEELELPPDWVNQLLLGIMGIERKIICWTGYIPVGTSLLCVARRPE
ncbi:MAG TPA: hypothetical protein DD723_06235 [Candidatus Omnitrophica bacterium]|nr:MAG: hypothetical protein A2Z81_06545 [Omnitrophica WOR_2 bacterium GWA2_45_18]HBR15123.1 hypothetical protein [Candidatus Omnitrophota bacterium]